MSELTTAGAERAKAEAVAPHIPPPQAYLASPVAEVVSVALFAAGGGLLAAAPGGSPGALFFGAGAALLGLIAQGVERGEARRLPWAGAIGLAATAAAIALGIVLLLAPRPPLTHLLGCAALIVVLGPVLARWASRFDRHEEVWRDVVRQGPPTGSSPLAARIAALHLPRPLGWLLLPLSLVGRGVCLLAILGYQLTFSRLMPPACRYEPSCSRYGFSAYRRYGVFRGSLLTALRLLRCSPIGSGGYDPIPSCDGHHPGGRHEGAR